MSKNPVMTTKELAEYIKMNEKTVLKMAQSGRLPGVKIGSQWRFHLEAIDSYLQANIMKSSDEELDLIIRTASNIIPLSRLMSNDYIKLNSKAEKIDEVLSDLAKMAYGNGLTASQDNLFRELKKRERMLSTAIGNGVAIPHPRHPSLQLFNEPKIIMMRTQYGIDYAAPDNQPVYIFFMTCAPSEFVHLRLLAKISKLLHRPDTIEKCMSAVNKEQITQMLLDFDRECMFPINRQKTEENILNANDRR